jgi:hypothetical protein
MTSVLGGVLRRIVARFCDRASHCFFACVQRLFTRMRRAQPKRAALLRKREKHGHNHNQGRNSGRLRVLVQDLHTRTHHQRISRDGRGSFLQNFLYRARNTLSSTRVHVLRGQAVGEQGRYGRNRLALEKHERQADSKCRLCERFCTSRTR